MEGNLGKYKLMVIVSQSNTLTSYFVLNEIAALEVVVSVSGFPFFGPKMFHPNIARGPK